MGGILANTGTLLFWQRAVCTLFTADIEPVWSLMEFAKCCGLPPNQGLECLIVKSFFMQQV